MPYTVTCLDYSEIDRQRAQRVIGCWRWPVVPATTLSERFPVRG
jgi:hypothetical protein